MNVSLLLQSEILQALGIAILHSLWQTCVIWLIYKVLANGIRSLTSSTKNMLGTAAVFISFSFFIYTFVSALYSAEGAAANESFLVQSAGATNDSWLVSMLGASLSKLAAFLPYLSAGYIFLLVFLMIKLFVSFRHVYLLTHHHLLPPPHFLDNFTKTAASQMKISRKIAIWLSEKIDVPATIGFFKPVILIPVASLNNLNVSQLEAIILHELAHIKRNDFVINILISVAETILFFNPFIALLSKAVKEERENCCDDNVINYRYDPQTYANALLSIARSFKTSPQLALAAVSGKKQLFQRIRRITGNPLASQQLNYGQKLLALIAVTTIICSISWIVPEKHPVHAGLPVVSPPVIATGDETKSGEGSIIERMKELTVEVAKSANTIQETPGVGAGLQLSKIPADENTVPDLSIEDNKIKISIATDEQAKVSFKMSKGFEAFLKDLPEDLLKQVPFNFKLDFDTKEIEVNVAKAIEELKKNKVEKLRQNYIRIHPQLSGDGVDHEWLLDMQADRPAAEPAAFDHNQNTFKVGLPGVENAETPTSKNKRSVRKSTTANGYAYLSENNGDELPPAEEGLEELQHLLKQANIDKKINEAQLGRLTKLVQKRAEKVKNAELRVFINKGGTKRERPNDEKKNHSTNFNIDSENDIITIEIN